MRVLVCGSRDWADAEKVDERLSQLQMLTTIVTGDARGADSMARVFARRTESPLEVFKADWGTHGRKAGILRNLEMLDTDPDLVIAFWDGQSPGTRHTKEEAEKRGIRVEVIEP